MARPFRGKRKMVPLRFFEGDYERLRAKIVQDHLTFQGLVETLTLAYLKGNKEIMKLVATAASEASEKEASLFNI